MPLKINTTMEAIMAEHIQGGFRNLIWVHDKNGKEYVCSTGSLKGDIHKKEDLSNEEQASCEDVSTIVGTERW